ncbi:small GTP-binding protein, putative [Trichomonas vaginalis G3]|uniref:Small GTP-binding protein, putative n=1 Tax=Trichomonas vaginalis (strain ATCC PRA-98 / G3) TaxID=412133 RepID=A2F1W8_TRIV3|nr:GTPase protein [Trichomonas vaginalis G3]EAY01113.1 small GTP-binding protein, putative [Trichomonas vaginalis G3]KAI5517432.1 GTPase protein [Trichomonas vaginalis G3]|eukprot:XP_001313965.1 small GTP-binding protein [Trichomonas vaginalis G3]
MSRVKIPTTNKTEIKVILVGNSGVGKTTLISAISQGKFNSDQKSTIAPSYSYLEIKNKKGTTSRLQVWDTAGQERYASISQIFYRDSSVALVCLEVGDENNINSAIEWEEKVLTEQSNCHIFYVITKSDMNDPKDTEAFADLLKKRLNNTQVFITSAKNMEGIKEPFEAAANLNINPFDKGHDSVDIAQDQNKDQKKSCNC